MTSPAQNPPPGYMPPAVSYRSRTAYLISQGAQQVPVPKNVPKAFGNSGLIVFMWIAAMGLVAADEWKNNKILPRPSRLWRTSLVYGILAGIGMAGALLPLANALAAGYTIVLAYQYFSGGGQFDHA